jgi:nitroreductase
METHRTMATFRRRCLMVGQGPSDKESDGKASKGPPVVINAIAAVRRGGTGACGWYNIVSAAKPVTDRTTVSSVAPDHGSGGGAGAAPVLRTSLREVEVETWDAIRSRRNVRSYGERAIAPQDLDQILEAARRAPSAGNQQAWDAVVCTNREQLTQLARVGQAAGHVAGSAATIALVAPKSDDPQTHDLIQLDLGQATMSVMLAATDLGIGSAHAGVHDQELARRLLGFPEDRFCALLITLGTPADRPLTPIQRPNRRPIDDVVHRGHW